ncbi:MAG: amidase family protein, partial [Nitrosopumilaceae archaeon]
MSGRQSWFDLNLGISTLKYIEEIKNGNLTAEEFISKTIERIQKVDSKLHAYLSINEQAVEQARSIDKKIKTKENVGACMGMPISIKDNICVKGTKTTCASKMLEDFISPYDATVVSKLKVED